MNKLLKVGIISFAFGLIFMSADTVNGQNRREARREYRGEVREAQRDRRNDVRESRRDYRNDIRSGENRRSARREYRGEVRDANREFRGERREARQDYRNDVRRGNRGWYRNNNGRQQFYPFASYFYRNGRFIRRY